MTQQERSQIQQELHEAQRLQGAYSAVHASHIAASVGINAIDLECLDLLQIHGPLPTGQLAAKAGLRTATMTSILDRLEKAGFVRRDRSEEDRRVVIVYILARAAQEIGPLFSHIATHMAKVEEQFSDDELAIVSRYTKLAASAAIKAIDDLRAPSSDK